MNETLSITTKNSEETISLGRRLGSILKGGEILALEGDLGAGKTTFTKGLAEGLGIPATVFSPTFTLIHEYFGPINLYHIDLYRISEDEAIGDLGIEEYFDSGGVCVIEWSERLGSWTPEERLEIKIECIGDDERNIVLTAFGGEYDSLLCGLRG